MSPEQIRRWRPTRFDHFIGEKNRAVIRRLQGAVLRKRIPSPLLFIAPFGYGKTSLIRLLMTAINCSRTDTQTGDPCMACEQCRCSGMIHNGQGSPYMRLELDCTQLGRKEVVGVTQDYFFKRDVALFFDEFHHLNERNSQEALLKFFEDYRGLAFAAVMQDRYKELIPPLRERFVEIWLSPPTEDDLAIFFVKQCAGDWRIDAPENLIRMMVRSSGLSFRLSLKILAAAAENEPRRLSLETLEEFLTIDHDAAPRDQPSAPDAAEFEPHEQSGCEDGPFIA